MSKKTIIAKIHSDGTIVEVLSGEKERPLPDTPMRTMTEAEIEAAAAADPDAKPMTAEELRAARRVPRIKTLRHALNLSQPEFAARYHIPLGTLRDWEQGRTEPDQPTRAYLTVIARNPEGVRHALKSAGSVQHRQDPHGKIMHDPGHGKTSEKGWEVDHVTPKSKVLSGAAKNLQALNEPVSRTKRSSPHKKNNHSKRQIDGA
ncbi:MAG: helix-turn-helix domain-containing protein [Syntrophobacteraceae bacterium]